MKTFLVFLGIISTQYLCSQTSLFIESGASVFVSPNAELTLTGDITNHGSYQSQGTELFNGFFNQIINGSFTDSNYLGQIVKNNYGDIIVAASIDCKGIDFQSDGMFWILGNDTVEILDASPGAVSGYSSDRAIVVNDNQGFFTRAINTTSVGNWYAFPLRSLQDYRPLDIFIDSLGVGDSKIVMTLDENQFASVWYDTVIPGICNPEIRFDCLGQTTWRLFGLSNTAVVLRAEQPSCGVGPTRILREENFSSDYHRSLEQVVGDLGTNLCSFTNWLGGFDTTWGGRYLGSGDFRIASNIGNPLGVTVIDIDALPRENRYIQVTWRTELEINNDHFEIQRSTDGIIFEQIGQVPGSGTSTLQHDYVFNDHQVFPSIWYYYKIVAVDFDGSRTETIIVSAQLSSDRDTKFLGTFDLLGQRVSDSPKTSGVYIIQFITDGKTWGKKVVF